MPATTKKPIKIVPNTIKTIPKVPLSPISKSKSFQEKLNDIQNNINIDIDDIPEDLLDIWNELQEDITPKLISKNYKLWLTIFTPFILPGIINGMSGKPAVPQPVVTVQEPAPDPKQIVNFAQKYFAEHGLELCKSLTKTDLNSMKQDLINNWGKGPDAFSKAFQDSYPVSKARLENIYRSERHIAEYHGVLERAKIADHKYKQWRAVGDERSCDLCMSHDMETVPINEPFSNGEMTATGHPQCRCSMVTYSEDDYNEMKEDSAYLDDVVNTIKLNYNCPDSEKNGSGPGSCGGNTDSKINLNPEIAPADYNSFFENFNKISKDKSEPDRIMRRLNAETVQRRFYRKTEEHFNEIKPENDKKLKENGEKLWDNLRPEVQSAIKSYTTQDYGVINSALQDDITREEVLLLKEATSKPLGVRTILYRGINFKMPKDIFKVGATWIHKPFASCSTGSFIAEEAASGKLTHITPEEKTILQIFTEPETKGFAVGKNSFHAGADAGSEVILDAGTKFQTIHSEKRGGMRILTVRAINDEQKQDSSYLEDVTNFIKLNYKCPKGTVDDSNKCDIEKPIVNIPIPNKFKDIDNVKSDKIRGESSEFLNQLVQNNEYLVNSLKSYTNIGHLEVNKYLGNRISGNIPKEIEKIIIGLDSIFNLQKEQNFLTSSSITTYRGVSDIEIENLLGLNQKHIYDIEPGKIITDPKFVSTTLNKEQALQFGRDRYGGSIITILIPKNSEALHTESVSGSEDELLINRNQSYKFLGVNKNIDNSGLDSNKPVHEFIFELVNANQKQSSSHLSDAVETIKLNYNCPDDEKIGSGPGSCSGGNTSNLDKVSTLKNKIRELEKSVSEGKSTFDEAYEQYKSIQKELDLELEKEKLRNPDNAKITNDIVTDPEPITPYKALSDYQNYAYTAINDYLRKTNHVKQNPQQTKNIQNMIKTIDSEMENNPLKSDKLVFRADSAGISSDAFEKTGLTNIFKDTFGKESLTLEDFIKNHKLIDKIREKLVGYEYTEKAYLSTGSDKENTMNRFLAPSRDISKYGVTGLINLIVPKGTPAIRIADYTGLEDELGGKIDEYLIGRDQTIVIDQVYIRPADDDRLYLEYDAHIKTNEQKQNSEYLEDVTNFIKLNYNCPDSEKIGSGPGSCGGNKPNGKHEPEKPIFDGVPKDLKLGKEFESEKQAVSRNEFKFKTEKKQGMYDTVYKINVIPKKIPTEWKNKKDTLDDKNIWYDPTYMKEVPFGNGKSTVVIPINPEIENQMKLPSGKEEGYLFRGMSYEEFEGIKKNGYIKTDAQYNFDFQGDMTFFSDEKSTASNYASGFAPWQYAPTIDKPAIMIKVKDPGNHEKGTTEGEIGIRGKISDELITEVYIGRPVSMVEGYFEIVVDKYNNNVYRGNASTYKSSVIWKIIPYNKQKQDSSYLEDVTNFIKLNYKCKAGTVDDSNKCELEQEKSNTSDSKHTSETFIGFKADHDFSSPQDVETNKRIQASLDKAAEPLKKFSKNDRHVLTMYSGGRFHQINEYLNGSMKDMENSNDVFDKANVKESKQLIEKLDKLFTNSDLSEPLVTYRGISNKTLSKYPELVNALDTPGSEIEFPCFSSTSALPFMANNFTTDENGRMGRLLELQLPSGTKALFIAEESVLPNEFEILVNRGTKFKVVETRYTDIIPPNNGSYKDRSAKHVKITTIKAIV